MLLAASADHFGTLKQFQARGENYLALSRTAHLLLQIAQKARKTCHRIFQEQDTRRP